MGPTGRRAGGGRPPARVAHERLAETGVSREDPDLGVIVVAVGSSWDAVNAQTAGVAPALAAETRWAGAITAFATGPRPSVKAAAQRLRRRGAGRLVIAPWFLAQGRITDRVADFAHANDIPMAQPLGAHPFVAETVLDRFDAACPPGRRLKRSRLRQRLVGLVGLRDRCCRESAAPGWPARKPCRPPSARAPRRHRG